MAPLDPRHVRVAQFAAPTPTEKRHHFLWRFWPVLPGWGGVAVLDRSWYGRVLVERVEQLTAKEHWKRAYQEINEFERTLVEEGTMVVKFFMHISSKEQLRRFEERSKDPLKRWKLTDDDWKNRGLREQYEQAMEEMFERTDTEHAHWRWIPADSKHYARVKVVEIVNAAIVKGLRRHGLDPPA